ncbi:metallophosphoesterase [Lawsonibacter sp. LCP25S3_G6]|uniref:metallophosphoesterase n=1 Tax=unclassified Lawsonibacter TaxID=2617946 RepID=UPI003F97EA8E
MKKKTILGLCLASALAAGTAGWLWWGNRAVMVHTISVTDRNLPHAFEGFRIAQISDLHNEVFGAGNGQLLTLLAETKPDVIVITGDLIDSRHTDVDAALEFARGAVELAPVYYVPGNHESRLPEEFWMLERSLDQMGVHVLRGERAILTRQGAAIALIGVDDPTFQDKNSARWPELLEAELERLRDEELYSILLIHRPELLETYAKAGMNLVFSGHAHGGQVRLPFVGGVIAPNQGFFPQYDGGLYTLGDTQMVVSRGLGNSLVPLRVNNRPEIVLAELHCE